MPDSAEKAQQCVAAVEEAISRAVKAAGGDTTAIKPNHRVPFHWPPHPVAPSYHIIESDWTGEAFVEVDGVQHPIKVARTPYGVFGRCDRYWVDARGESLHEMLRELENRCAPLLARQKIIAETLGQPGRFGGSFSDLGPADWVRLLYCVDRDVANEARSRIETYASSKIFGPALIRILQDDRHPHRRIAQWCVLDLFEDLSSFCPDPESQHQAILAIRNLIWNAPDDYARTIYKAGVVLGGHVSNEPAADALIECFRAPSRIGRRSAVHASFHLAEWLPARREQIIESLNWVAANDPEPAMREFAASIARDILAGEVDHMMEPVFDGE
ncbi:MAG: hypothetical protein K1X67_15665 [Fimbriimonadaceae bacterium]|nr:hypothetical protein [Fimbriimonadaceae bacterium]